MDKPIIYSGEQGRTFDILNGWNDALIALANMEQDITGNTTGQLAGFAASQTAPASLTINLAAGRVYQQSAVDSTAYGALPSNSILIQQQGSTAAQQIIFTTSGMSAGQSQWALVECQFAQVDEVAPGDPTGGLLLYFNSANPSEPLQGPGGDGQVQPSLRLGTASVRVIYGAAATTGSEVPPNVDNGWLPLYLVDLTFGQSQVLSNQILVSGPSVGTNVPNNYPGAPFVAGLLNQHHRGIAGQAPKIDLTSEVEHLLPLANLPASSTSGGGIPVFKRNNGNPNGNVSGNSNVNGANDICWDFTNNLLYTCTATGTTSTAIWTSVVGSSTSQFAGGTSTGTANAQVVASTTPSGFARTPGQVVTFTVGPGPNTTAATLNVDSTGVAAINKVSGGSNVPLTGGELTVGEFLSVIWTGAIYLLQSATLGQLATLNIGEWLKNDGSGNLTINVDPSLQDNGSGELQVTPTYLPPSGSILPYVGAVAPTGYVLAQGQAVSRTGATANLFAACGVTFGGGDGITTFNVPDLRGRVIAGVDTGQIRLSTFSMSSPTIGGTGGAEGVAITVATAASLSFSTTTGTDSPDHAHTINGGANFVVGSGGFNVAGGSGATSPSGATSITGLTSGATVRHAHGVSGTTSGSGGAHLNVQPTMELSYIIKL